MAHALRDWALANRNVRLPLVPAGEDLVAHLRAELATAGLLPTAR